MGLLDLLNKKVSTIGTNPLAMGLLTYGMTGQGSDPLGSGMQAMVATAQNKAKADEMAKLKAQQQALQQAVIGGFSRGSVDPALLAQYATMGGEGASNLIDMNKFNNTPQQITPGVWYVTPPRASCLCLHRSWVKVCCTGRMAW